MCVMTQASIKAELHRLVDELPEAELYPAKRYLVYLRNMGDPVFRALEEAPYDDEPETPEERAAIEEGLKDLSEGNVFSAEEVKRELNL
jgi:hypothetical protein